MTGGRQWSSLLLLTAALASLWLYIHTSRTGDRGSALDPQPELIIRQPDWTRFNGQGQPVRSMHAERLEQWSHEQGARLIEPRLEISDRQQRLWRVQARQGRIYQDGQPLLLERQVTVTREPEKSGLVLTTEHLRIADGTDRVETDAAVVLQAGSWHFTSQGLRTDLGGQRLELLEQVRGIHE